MPSYAILTHLLAQKKTNKEVDQFKKQPYNRRPVTERSAGAKIWFFEK